MGKTLLALIGALAVIANILAEAAEISTNMVLIAAGPFQMGDTFKEGNSDELPLHTVYVSSFYIDKYLVTKALWDDVYRWAIRNGYSFDELGSGKATNHPVHTINWFDVVKWCNARSEKEGRVPAYYMDRGQTKVYRMGLVYVQNDWVKRSAGYRLPTEAEWEKAARGGTGGHRFSWSDADTITHKRANYYNSGSHSYAIGPTFGNHPVFNDSVFPYTNPVDYFTPNEYGLYDMTGNVWQWCWDWYGPYSSNSQTDPYGPDSGSCRLMRGGSWRIDEFYCRSSYRLIANWLPLFSHYSIGLRSVLSSTSDPVVQVIQYQTVQPTYSEPPKKEVGKDSLVIVTHGWVPKGLFEETPPTDVTWVGEMENAINSNLTKRGSNNWQVASYKWIRNAWTTKVQLALGITLGRAEREGENLGNSIVSKEWKHVHLIGHSAGAALIQAASEKIKDKWPNTTVHLTFLDPYVGIVYGGRNKYGYRTDWADSYFSRDLETSGETFSFTEGILKHAFNVDVTFLDKSKTKKDVYYSSSGSIIQSCQEATTTHQWPHEFYTQTILPSVLAGAENFGFQLSKESGNWNPTITQYKDRIGNSPSFVLGTRDLSCLTPISETTPAYIGNRIIFPTTQSTTSLTGIIKENDFGINFISMMQGVKLQSLDRSNLSATSTPSVGPAWFLSTITVTNTINFLSFETFFSSGSGSEGLLSVYWETNVIGTIDERVSSSGIHQYIFPFPKVTNGTQTLGFRLDSFSQVASSATVTNVLLGFAGVKEPFSLSFAGSQTNGTPILQLTGQKDFNYTVETSTDLVDWKFFATLVNTDGVVRFNTAPKDTTARFYRAVAP